MTVFLREKKISFNLSLVNELPKKVTDTIPIKKVKDTVIYTTLGHFFRRI